MAAALNRPTEAAEHLRLSALFFKNQNDPHRQAQAIELLAMLDNTEVNGDSPTPKQDT